MHICRSLCMIRISPRGVAARSAASGRWVGADPLSLPTCGIPGPRYGTVLCVHGFSTIRSSMWSSASYCIYPRNYSLAQSSPADYLILSVFDITGYSFFAQGSRIPRGVRTSAVFAD